MGNSAKSPLRRHSNPGKRAGRLHGGSRSLLGGECSSLLARLAFILVFFFSPGCKAQESSQQVQKPQVFLLFQKTPCFGTCPAYEATIYENGNITFVGWEHVAVKDTLHLKLTPKENQALHTAVKGLHYTSLNDAYRTQWTDMPSTITTFFTDGRQVKRVKHQEGGPERLLQFQEHLHTLITHLVEAEAKKRAPEK